MLTPADIPGFFASRAEIDSKDYVFLRYLFETKEEPRLVAATLCSEQSTAQWNRPGKEEDFRPRYAARVIDLKELGGGRWEVEIAHPHRNFGPRIPNFLSAAAGEGPFYCPGIETIRWTDFEFPENFLKEFEGPQFGLEGLRELLGIYQRPFFIGVVKPNIGLTPAEFAGIAYRGWVGGLDIAKDDEMLADMDDSPLAERVALAGQARLKVEKETGLKKLFIANITDEVDRIGGLYDVAVDGGANCVMINAIMTGLSALRPLRRRSKVPIVSHFAGTACLSRVPNFGISSLVMTKLQRLAGADIVLFAGFGERMRCSDTEVLANVEACLKPWGSIRRSLPVPGGSDTPETLPKVFRKIGHADFGFICGRGVFGHPQGPEAGARGLVDAWARIRQDERE